MIQVSTKWSKNKKQISDDYYFVFEDQIDFIKTSIMDACNIDNEEVSKLLKKSKEKSALDAHSQDEHLQ